MVILLHAGLGVLVRKWLMYIVILLTIMFDIMISWRRLVRRSGRWWIWKTFMRNVISLQTMLIDYWDREGFLPRFLLDTLALSRRRRRSWLSILRTYIARCYRVGGLNLLIIRSRIHKIWEILTFYKILLGQAREF